MVSYESLEDAPHDFNRIFELLNVNTNILTKWENEQKDARDFRNSWIVYDASMNYLLILQWYFKWE